MLLQRNVNCFMAPLHSTAADRAYIVCKTAWRETDWGEGITTTTVSIHLFICHVSRLALFTHSLTPLAVFCHRRPLRTVQMVITWTAPLTVSHPVSRPKKISPDTDITQYTVCKYRPIPNNPIPVSFEP